MKAYRRTYHDILFHNNNSYGTLNVASLHQLQYYLPILQSLLCFVFPHSPDRLKKHYREVKNSEDEVTYQILTRFTFRRHLYIILFQCCCGSHCLTNVLIARHDELKSLFLRSFSPACLFIFSRNLIGQFYKNFKILKIHNFAVFVFLFYISKEKMRGGRIVKTLFIEYLNLDIF